MTTPSKSQRKHTVFNLATPPRRFGGIALFAVIATIGLFAALSTVVGVPNQADASSHDKPILTLTHGSHPATASTENGSPTLRYQIKATGDRTQLALFCGGVDAHQPNGFPCPNRQSSQPQSTVPLELDIEWQDFDEFDRQHKTGLLVHTKTAITPHAAVNSNNMGAGEEWYWDRTITGISRHEERPLRATVTMTVKGSKARAGSTTSVQLAINPQIIVFDDDATEGTDTHLEFVVGLYPPAVETTTIDYATSDGSATAGSDYTATSGTITFAVNENQKVIRVPITDDMVNDSGEHVVLTLSNASGANRFIVDAGPGNPPHLVDTLALFGTILNDEPGPTDTVENLPLVKIEKTKTYVPEGEETVFALTRSGDTTNALRISVATSENGDMLPATPPSAPTFAAGESETELRLSTVDDATAEIDSNVTIYLINRDTYRLGTNEEAEATMTILDNDPEPTPGPTAYVAGTTVWTADMTVEDYENENIGAGTATLLANQRGTEDLSVKWLYYDTDQRQLRMAFTTNVDSGGLTLKGQGVDLPFPDGTSGNSSFTWDDVDVSWTDDQTFKAHLVRGEVKAKSAPDPTLKTLAISGATLSTAFDVETVLYKATVSASTDKATVTAVPNDTGTAVKFDPAQDADSTQDNHQVAVPVGQSLASVTVTTSDGEAQRTYRILFTRPPTVEVSFGSVSYTATEGGDPASVTVNLSADPKRDVSIPLTASPGGGATTGDYTVAESVVFTAHGPLSKTVDVAAVSDDDSEDEESVSLSFGTLPDGVSAQGITSATVTLADVSPEAVNTAPTGLPTITGTPQVNETLTASVSGITDADGTESATFTYQWVSNNGTSDSDIDDADSSTYILAPSDEGNTIKVRVTFTDDGGTEETLVSAATTTVAAAPEATTPTVSIAGGSGTEGDDDIDFTVTLDEAASGTVTVDYSTSDGSADAGDDYTAKSGTLSFSAGETSKTISIAIEDDIENESDETFTVTLSNASGADLGTDQATGTIVNRYVPPLTATFSNVPDSHSGSGEFTFDLSFSENFPLSYRTLRDHAFTEDDHGPVTRAQRKVQGSNQTWTITVEPSGNGAITITLPATTDCNATGAICTDNGRKLSNSNSVSVSGPQ